MNAKTKALKVKSEGGENKIAMSYINKNGIKRLSSKEQAEKIKDWPKAGSKMSPHHEAQKQKMIRKGHGYLK